MTTKLTHKERADKLSLDLHAKVIFLTQIVPAGISERFLMEVNDLISEAFTQVANEALEEAAIICDKSCHTEELQGVSMSFTIVSPFVVSEAIRALKQEVKS